MAPAPEPGRHLVSYGKSPATSRPLESPSQSGRQVSLKIAELRGGSLWRVAKRDSPL